jgi:hypothetical protein
MSAHLVVGVVLLALAWALVVGALVWRFGE